MSQTEQFTEVITHWTGVFMRRSSRDFLQTMKEHSLSMPQISTLMRLYYQADCDVSSIGAYVGVTNAAASQMVDRLFQSGLLTREEDPHDRRVKRLALSSKGRQLIETLLEARRRWMGELTSLLTPQEQDDIIHSISLLTGAAENLEKQSTAGD